MDEVVINLKEILERSRYIGRKKAHVVRKKYKSKYESPEEVYSLTKRLMEENSYEIREIVFFKEKHYQFKDSQYDQKELKECLKLGIDPTQLTHLKGLRITLKKRNCHDILIEVGLSLPPDGHDEVSVLTGVGNIPYFSTYVEE